MSRGLFVVFEGVDGAGKSTQIKIIQSKLQSRGIRVEVVAFPARKTTIGSFINKYLLEETQHTTPETLHLLFSANRWELQKHIITLLLSGITVLCDRYAYSGIAYSVGIHNLNFKWSLEADRGLIQPDVVYQLVVDPDVCAKRASYGRERYEKISLQKAVEHVYKEFHKNPYWKIISSATTLSKIKNLTLLDAAKELCQCDVAINNNSETCVECVSAHILDDLLGLYCNNELLSDLKLRKLGDSLPW